MQFKTIRYEVQSGIGTLTLDRPEVRNALDLDMRGEISAVVELVRADASVRSLVITGAGDAFCAGGDLASLSEATAVGHALRDRVRRLHDWFERLVNLEKPVIAAVNGAAFGAGLNLALAADFVLCSTRARFCAVFGRIGLVPDLGGFFLLPRIVGLQRAKEMIFTTREVLPQEARDLGMAFGIYPPDALMPAAMALAERFNSASTQAIGLSKNILNQSFNLDQRALAELESYAQAIAIGTEYHQDAVKQFLGKRGVPFGWKPFPTDTAAGEPDGNP